jgi:hypothetical protein
MHQVHRLMGMQTCTDINVQARAGDQYTCQTGNLAKPVVRCGDECFEEMCLCGSLSLSLIWTFMQRVKPARSLKPMTCFVFLGHL